MTLLKKLLKGEEKTAEEKEYLWAVDGEDGLIKLILDLNEMVVHLQGHLVQVLRKQGRSVQSLTPNLREPIED